MTLLSYYSSLKRFDKFIIHVTVFLFLQMHISGCKKLIEIPPPVSTITTEQVFASPAEATAAMAGIYSELISGNANFASYSTTVYCGMSADELTVVNTTEGPQFAKNNLFSGNLIVGYNFWQSLYANVYRANAIIEGLQNSTNINDSIKAELVGEARFIRAFCNFYLVNLFGPVPLVTTSNWRKTNLLARAPTDKVYEQIVADLKDAKEKLAKDYSVGKGERIIPNKTAATALLARVYLYMGDLVHAEQEATTVINSPEMALEPLENIFGTKSREAIWQLKQNNTSGTYNATPEGYFIRPLSRNSDYQPGVWITDFFLNSLQPEDHRKDAWVDSTRFAVDNLIYYFPGKYKEGLGEAIVNGPYKQYYMVLRLAEQYLIRAEALIKQNQYSKATEDINLIRIRAGLGPLETTLSPDDIMNALIKERQVEFFAEWGNRWLDLKRWGLADGLLGTLKGSDWQPTDKLYPIPDGELKKNANMTQNDGY
ncbi:RagB/SusD family nutrient uptake outer membrane protein [Niabella beijingensis]|uniref:RagB/SusD family nutrient uptake outer membrane protein n=1 Tax=Niabella beijingensis TaxID=2872700 RepID=UPI001CBC75B1|nr:RagB/SusD family nutrient uptake outer membrane protein [Niabella beijingensis]MBZ4187627.1 RagB/SusD family nutrient uptake outer membrane protein [Niabella beijingensis]